MLILKYRVLSLYPCSHRVLNEGCSFIKSSLKNKENSRPTKTHEAESVQTLVSSPKLLLTAIKSFRKTLLSDRRTVECWEIESIFSQLKVWNEIRWKGVEKFIWLRTPLYTRQQLMNFGFYKIQGISRLALQLAASEDGLSSSELVADEFTCSIKVYLTRIKLTWLYL